MNDKVDIQGTIDIYIHFYLASSSASSRNMIHSVLI